MYLIIIVIQKNEDQRKSLLLKIRICAHVWGIHLQRSAENWSQFILPCGFLGSNTNCFVWPSSHRSVSLAIYHLYFGNFSMNMRNCAINDKFLQKYTNIRWCSAVACWCVRVFPLHLYLCITWVQCLQKPEGGVRSSRMEVTGSWITMWVLRTDPRSSGRLAWALNC